MDKLTVLKAIESGASVVFKGRNGKDVIVVDHSYDYIYTVSLNGFKKDFLLKEAVVWLDFYESKRGAIVLDEVEVEAEAAIFA